MDEGAHKIDLYASLQRAVPETRYISLSHLNCCTDLIEIWDWDTLFLEEGPHIIFTAITDIYAGGAASKTLYSKKGFKEEIYLVSYRFQVPEHTTEVCHYYTQILLTDHTHSCYLWLA